MNTINTRGYMTDIALIGWTKQGECYVRGEYMVYHDPDLDEWVFADSSGDPLVGGATPEEAIKAGKKWLSDLFLKEVASNATFNQHCELLDAERF